MYAKGALSFTETCFPLSGVSLAFLPPGFLWHYRYHWHVCQWECYLTSNLASLGLNPSWMYICWSFKAIISSACTLCTHRILIYCSQCILLWQRVPLWRISMFMYSASGSASLSSWGSGSTLGSELCLYLQWHVTGPPAEDIVQALLCLMIVPWLLGISSPA